MDLRDTYLTHATYLSKHCQKGLTTWRDMSKTHKSNMTNTFARTTFTAGAQQLSFVLWDSKWKAPLLPGIVGEILSSPRRTQHGCQAWQVMTVNLAFETLNLAPLLHFKIQKMVFMELGCQWNSESPYCTTSMHLESTEEVHSWNSGIAAPKIPELRRKAFVAFSSRKRKRSIFVSGKKHAGKHKTQSESW